MQRQLGLSGASLPERHGADARRRHPVAGDEMLSDLMSALRRSKKPHVACDSLRVAFDDEWCVLRITQNFGHGTVEPGPPVF